MWLPMVAGSMIMTGLAVVDSGRAYYSMRKDIREIQHQLEHLQNKSRNE